MSEMRGRKTKSEEIRYSIKKLFCKNIFHDENNQYLFITISNEFM
jgi:hypothetical protein